MPSTVEQLSPTRVKLTIEIPFADLKPSLDRVYKEIANQVQIPGFRKGKVPAPIIDQRIGRGAVLQDAINDYLPTAYVAAITEHEIAPLGQPDIEVTKLEDGDVVEFTAELDVRPEFELPNLDEIEVTVDPATVTDEAINKRLDMMRDRFATVVEVEREAAEGDQVVLDLTASKDGEELDDAKAEGVSYIVGRGGMVEGLDDAITGKKAGEEVTFTSKLVGGQFKDEDADIKVTLQQVSERTLPEVDEEFAQMISQFDTVDEMMADLRNAMENEARVTQINSARDKALEEIVAKTDFELPEALVNDEVEARKAQIVQQLASAGLTLERYLKETDFEEAETEEEFYADLEKRTIEGIRAQIILDKVVDDEKPDVSQEELLQLIYQKAVMNNSSPEQELKHMMEHQHQDEWMQEVRRGKVLSQIISKIQVKDTDGNEVDTDSINQDGSLKEQDSSPKETGDDPDIEKSEQSEEK